MKPFRNRNEAGRALADELVKRNYSDPVVLVLPRGGVPIGLEVARRLKAPLDLIMVRKIGVPNQPELAAAAVVNGDHPELVINEAIVAKVGLGKEEIESLAEVQLAEIKRRRSIYLKGRTAISVEGKTAIVVDDGIATGATVRASLKAARRRNPARLVLAVPVASATTLERLRAEVDDLICLKTPEPFFAVGAHFTDFSQVSDEEVVRLLDEAGWV